MFTLSSVQNFVIWIAILFGYYAFTLAAENDNNYAGKCEAAQSGNALWKPRCAKDGTYEAVQYKGEYSNGRAFCFSPSGLRIFGWSWWKSSETMTCACSRRREELKSKGATVTLHCMENGNYEELQCDNGLCWCVKSETGIPTQRVYPESVMIYLPCYKKKEIGSQYLRRCESKFIARTKLLEKIKYHGYNYFQLDNVYCDGDGSYSSYQIFGRLVRCTWKNGSIINDYKDALSNIESINCNCARDTEHPDFKLVCEDNGNYLRIQHSNADPFCVDDDGFATTVLGNKNCPLI